MRRPDGNASPHLSLDDRCGGVSPTLDEQPHGEGRVTLMTRNLVELKALYVYDREARSSEAFADMLREYAQFGIGREFVLETVYSAALDGEHSSVFRIITCSP